MQVQLMPSDPEFRADAERALTTIIALLLAFFLGLWAVIVIIIHPDLRGTASMLVSAYLLTTSILYVNARGKYRLLSSSATLLVGIPLLSLGITGIVNLTGSTSSQSAGLYIILLMVTTAFFSPRAGLLALGSNVVFYVSLLSAEHIGWLEYALAYPEKKNLVTSSRLLLSGAIATSFYNGTAFVIAYVLYRLLHAKRMQLRAANERLLALDAAKSRYLGIVSHDLRTPVTSIKAFGELIQEETRNDTVVGFSQTIVAEADRLHRLVTDLLDLEKMEAGGMEWDLRLLDIRPILKNCAQVFHAAAFEKGVTLVDAVADDLPEIPADGDRLSQLVSNLLSNAIKFTPEGGTVTLHAAANQNHLEIAVADTGPGIAPEDVSRLFDRFSQTQTGKDHAGGTGLGLAIAKEIAEGHNGRITVDSTLGRGTTFTVTVPIQ